MYRDHRKQVDFEGKLGTGDQVSQAVILDQLFLRGWGGGGNWGGFTYYPKYQNKIEG